MSKQNITYVLVAVTGLLFFGASFRFFEYKVKNSIMQDLQRDYVPGPFSPGFDPDKLDPSLLKELKPETDPKIDIESTITPDSFNKTWR